MLPNYNLGNYFQQSSYYYTGGDYNFAYHTKYSLNGYGVNTAVTYYAEHQNPNDGYQYGSYYHPALGGQCVMSSYEGQGYGYQNYGNTQENLDFSVDYDDDNGYTQSEIVPYRQNNSNRYVQPRNSRYPQKTNRYQTRKYHNHSKNRYNGYALQTRRSPRRNSKNQYNGYALQTRRSPRRNSKNQYNGYALQTRRSPRRNSKNRYNGYALQTRRSPRRNSKNRYNGYALQTRRSPRRNYYQHRSITCYTCGEVFYNKTALFAHRDEAHSTRTYYCSVCNKQFSVLKLMKEHEKTHTMQACTECPEIFKFKDSLIAHKKHAHGPPLRTEEPAKNDPSIDKSGFKNFASPVAASTPAPSFSDPSQDSGVHVKLEAHACSHCIKSFDSEEKLKNHSKIHTDLASESQASHTDLASESQVSQTESQSSDKLSCPFCIKKFSTRRELTLHLESAHTRVYYCRLCSAEYSTQTELDAHSKVHI